MKCFLYFYISYDKSGILEHILSIDVSRWKICRNLILRIFLVKNWKTHKQRENAATKVTHQYV